MLQKSGSNETEQTETDETKNGQSDQSKESGEESTMKNGHSNQCKGVDDDGDSKVESEQGKQNGSMEEGTKAVAERSLLSSTKLNRVVTILYIASKVVIIITNVVFFFFAKLEDDPSLSTEQKTGKMFSYILTVGGFGHEIFSFLFIPILLCMFCKCWEITKETFGGYYRYYDLQLVLTVIPFINVHLHYLGGLYWIFIIIRACAYSITIIAAIILGIRAVIAIWCLKCSDIPCCSKTDAVEIKNWKHLFKDIGFLLVVLTIKITTGSSALATFFKIGIIQSDPVKFTYLAFTLFSCLNAVFSILYNAILLRWIVMKEDNKADESRGSKALEFLKFKVPSSHISFALAVCINCGLIVLNAYILNHGKFQ